MNEENLRIIGIPPGVRGPYVDIKPPDHKPVRPEGFNTRGPLSRGADSEGLGAVVRRFLVRKGLASPRR
jgi:hypothetical protein